MSVKKDIPRYCLECGADISHRGGQAKFCKPCADRRRNEKIKVFHERRRKYPASDNKPAYSDFDALSGKSITEIAVLARKSNMSYGQYAQKCREAGRVI